MSNEKLIILTMLEQGKISCDEAIRLIEALGSKSENNKKNTDSDTIVSKTMESTLGELNSKISSITKNLSEKFESMGKEINNKAVIDTENISSKLRIFEDEYKEKLDSMLKSISQNKDIISPKLFDKTSELKKYKGSDKFNSSLDTIQTYFQDIPVNIPDIETKMAGILSSLNLKGDTANTLCTTYKRNLIKNENISINFENINGNISIEGYDEDYIDLKVYTKSSRNIREVFTLVNDKDTYGIKAFSVADTTLSIEAYIPRSKISQLHISSSNGRLSLSDINCEVITIISHDSRVSLSGIYCKLLKAGTQNSKIEFSDGILDKITVKSMDTPVLIYNLNCMDFTINTSNSRIVIEMSEDCSGTGFMDLLTKSGRIDIDLSQCISMGVNIEAINIDGSIDISVPGTVYSNKENLDNGGTRIVCQSGGYESCPNKISIKASTSKETISIK